MWRNWDNKAIINAKEIESAVTLVITTCTNRKRQSVTGELRICTLPSAHLADLAAEWGDRLSSAEVRFPAHEIYGGRGFQEARSVARELNAHRETYAKLATQARFASRSIRRVIERHGL